MSLLIKLLAQAKDLNILRWNLTIKDTIIKYKEIILGVDSPIWIECLNEFQKQQVVDKRAYQLDTGLRKLDWYSLVMHGNMMLDEKTAEVLGAEVNYTCYKDKF